MTRTKTIAIIVVLLMSIIASFFAVSQDEQDFGVSENDISFSDTNPTEGKNITISVNVHYYNIQTTAFANLTIYLDEREEKGKAIAEKVITRKACERIVKFGFDYSLKNKRKKISAIHKANVLKKTDGMFREIFYEIAGEYRFEKNGNDNYDDKSINVNGYEFEKNYDDNYKNKFGKISNDKYGKNSYRHKNKFEKISDNYNEKSIKIDNKISYDDYYVDATAMHLILNPEKFDVILTLNLYGDILSDLTAGLIGGLGFAPSGNIGEKYSIFEPIHGSAVDIAGKGIANPTAMILSAKMLLEHLGFKDKAEVIDKSLKNIFKKKIFTKDVGGKYNTKEFTKEVVKDVRKLV